VASSAAPHCGRVRLPCPCPTDQGSSFLLGGPCGGHGRVRRSGRSRVEVTAASVSDSTCTEANSSQYRQLRPTSSASDSAGTSPRLEPEANGTPSTYPSTPTTPTAVPTQATTPLAEAIPPVTHTRRMELIAALRSVLGHRSTSLTTEGPGIRYQRRSRSWQIRERERRLLVMPSVARRRKRSARSGTSVPVTRSPLEARSKCSPTILKNFSAQLSAIRQLHSEREPHDAHSPGSCA
jgi:hypothetical protein